MIRLWITVISLLLAVQLPAQSAPGEWSLEQLGEADEPIDLDEPLLQQEYGRLQPIRINSITADGLQQLQVLTTEQISAFLQYRDVFGPFASRYELQAIPGWEADLIRSLLPRIDLTQRADLLATTPKMFREGRYQWLYRAGATVQPLKGQRSDSSGTKAFAGSSLHLYTRLTYQYEQQCWYGFTLEKDPGERGNDFTGFHLMWKGKGLLQGVAVGDYSINIGQGLLCWQSLAFGITGDALAIYRQGKTVQVYRSAGEDNFHRGLAAALGYKNWQLLLFGSARPRTATLTGDSIGGQPQFSSLSGSGYHRTEAERRAKNALKERTGGMELVWANHHLRVGFSVIYSRFSGQYQPSGALYQLYSWKGDRLLNTGIHYAWSWRNLFLFGEMARQSGALAQTHALLLHLSRSAEGAILFRSLSPQYAALYGNAFSRSSRTNNEQGLYTGWKWPLTSRVTVQVYADYCRFPWLRYRVSAPSSGAETGATVTYTERKKWNVYVRWRWQQSQRDNTDTTVAYLEQQQKNSLRCHVEKLWGLQTVAALRLEKNFITGDSSRTQGWSAFGEAQYNWAKTGLRFSARLAFFGTDGYDNRIYNVEKDLLYAYAVPAVEGQGWRYYLQVQGKSPRLWKTLAIQWWLRWASTQYGDRIETGSGYSSAAGRLRSDWRMQVLLIW